MYTYAEADCQQKCNSFLVEEEEEEEQEQEQEQEQEEQENIVVYNLRYHIIDLPGVVGNNVLGSYNCSYDLIRCIDQS